MIAYLNTKEDIDWLKEVHLKEHAGHEFIKAAILYGNEDAPTKVDVWDEEDPDYDTPPFMTIRFS